MAWRRVWQSVAISCLAFSWLAASPAPSLACSCASGAPTVDVVFVGRVVAVMDGKWVRKRLHARDYFTGSTVGLLTVWLMWQGEERPFFAVVGGSGEGNCTLNFVPGATYPVYGQLRGSGPLDTNICLGSRQMDDAAVISSPRIVARFPEASSLLLRYRA